ncbi:MAG: cupredoxin domain-containing protein [Patescibacteria group bacterium]
MKRILLFSIISLVIMEGVVWIIFGDIKDEPSSPQQPVSEEVSRAPETGTSLEVPVQAEEKDYPWITTEVKNDRIERTIHMGVRQWVWEPSILYAKEGELVRFVIHNADVRHPLVIPDLGIEADVPPEGAVVEFVATRKGVFDFLCGTYCGVGHAEMQGRIVIE